MALLAEHGPVTDFAIVAGMVTVLGGALVWIVKSMFGLMKKMVETQSEGMEEFKSVAMEVKNASRDQIESMDKIADEVTTMRMKIVEQNSKLDAVIQMSRVGTRRQD